MKTIHPIVKKWFDCWNNGVIEDLPIADDFSHTSPFGTITPKSEYMDIVLKNKNDFLGNTLTIIKQIQEVENVCVQFEQKNKNTGLEMTVCEWYNIKDGLIKSIHSFYNIGNAEIKG
ncbi:nuclear transport factor 2 family protein [uncultured Psychroserpens sp.]|uniref:nuclear transport factor 2 family protein n=1 Tax=uncultured Psychroserpens sp. TaxID=255436 RepID=UPI00261782D7|nr:nuclear transport factor 2 family protein [uncultured Psychroserpens sp.]